MKTLIINKNSWHYHLASEYSTMDFHYFTPNDICSYLWHVFLGFIGTLIITAAFSFLSFTMGVMPLMYAISGFDSLLFEMYSVPLIASALCWVICLVITLICFLRKLPFTFRNVWYEIFGKYYCNPIIFR